MKFSNNGIGIQDFEKIRENNAFYIDKTHFISEWWKGGSDVTLITRPRRFGKTLNMSMLECFFSNKYEGRSELFEGLSISADADMMALQGTFPVIAMSFANIKPNSYDRFKYQILSLLNNLYELYPEVKKSEDLTYTNESILVAIKNNLKLEIDESILISQISDLSQKLYDYHGKKVIIILDEYDTPMIEAYVNGYWDEAISFMRSFFNATFKTNKFLCRAIMTGITRISRESMFSDFNNARIYTMTSEKYATCFGFTEEEVFDTLDMYEMTDKKEDVKKWYDGFRIGNVSDIYNPWSIACFLDEGKCDSYWSNTSSNSLVDELIKKGKFEIKAAMGDLLKGIPIVAELDENMVFDDLTDNENAIWSLLFASGYFRADSVRIIGTNTKEYTLSLTNLEVMDMFERKIRMWFRGKTNSEYNAFIKALLKDDKEAMNYYMNKVALSTFSSFDVGNKPSEQCEPERFYHGFVLGLLVELKGSYQIHSNRESGFGRYDIMLEPLKDELPGIVIEFKVINPNREKTLEDTLNAALAQIEEKAYDNELIEKGITKERIFHYGFVFEGKKVLIG